MKDLVSTTHNIADIIKQPGMLSTHERRGLVLIRAFMDDIAFNEKGMKSRWLSKRN